MSFKKFLENVFLKSTCEQLFMNISLHNSFYLLATMSFKKFLENVFLKSTCEQLFMNISLHNSIRSV